MKKRVVLLMLVMMLVVSLAACGGKDENSANNERKEEEQLIDESKDVDDNRKTTVNSDARYEKITIGVNSDPQDLMPYNPNVASKPYIYYNFYETLFDMDNEGGYTPVLAKGYEEIDELHYEVEIYDYIYDSAGNHITADDIIYCYDFLISSGYAFKYGAFEGIEKKDDYTVVFTWTKPITGVNELEFPWCRTFIFSQKAFEENNFATGPIATGPYVVERFVSGSSVVLEANDNYWQIDKSLITLRHEANVQTIQFDIISETSQQVIALQTGTIDFSQYIPGDNLAEFQDGGQYGEDYIVNVEVGSRMYSMYVNTSESSLCNDKNLRKAIFYAIDNEACATVSGNSTGATAYGTPFFTDYVDEWGTTPNYINTFDAELAKEYLEKSNYNGETLKLMGGNDEVSKNLLTIIQTFLVNVGIDAEIQMVETATLGNHATEPTAWDMQIDTLAGGTQIGAWNRVMNNQELANGMSMGFIEDAKLQELYETANMAASYNAETMTELHNYGLEQAYYYSLILPYQNFVYSTDIAELYLRENNYILPGAFTYYLD